MTELTFENLLAALRPLHEELSGVRNRVDNLGAGVDGLGTEIADLRRRVDGLGTEIADLRRRVDGLGAEIADLRSRVDGLGAEIADLRSRVDGLGAEIADLRRGVDGLGTRADGLAAEMANVLRIRVDGLPLLGVAVETLRQDVRMTRAAINDIARINITAGEVEALHDDINRTMARQDAFEKRLAAIERRTGAES